MFVEKLPSDAPRLTNTTPFVPFGVIVATPLTPAPEPETFVSAKIPWLLDEPKTDVTGVCVSKNVSGIVKGFPVSAFVGNKGAMANPITDKVATELVTDPNELVMTTV